VGGEVGGRGHLSAKLVAQQALIEALDGGQQRQFPFGVLSQGHLLRDRALLLSNGHHPLVKPKGKGCAIGYLVTEVAALIPLCRDGAAPLCARRRGKPRLYRNQLPESGY